MAEREAGRERQQEPKPPDARQPREQSSAAVTLSRRSNRPRVASLQHRIPAKPLVAHCNRRMPLPWRNWSRKLWYKNFDRGQTVAAGFGRARICRAVMRLSNIERYLIFGSGRVEGWLHPYSAELIHSWRRYRQQRDFGVPWARSGFITGGS